MKINLFPLVLIGLAGITIAGCASQARQADDNARQQIARQYGIDGFDQVETIRFTFNAQVGAKQVQRKWEWKPAAGEVRHWADSQPAVETFIHPMTAEPSDASLKALDAKFINDRYWLLFPLHLVWDQSAEVADRGQARNPLRPGKARRIEVRYPPAGGYTPGDVYELFIGTDGQIVAWVYRRGGSEKPTRMSTWENHRRLGPLLISLDHNGPDGFRVWFTDVALKIRDQSGWVYPED
ncbi:MAG: hypothetical protein QNJ48_04315 [Desulfobacterales bacterium]|nr:hypothetical protein [Desulfobacterales bacterium]MDJ0883356.1 hypothetical protein [Desulfobacterales bacterium]